jgi:hypothetical protein
LAEVSVSELQPGDRAEWTVRFDPFVHGGYGYHVHAVILRSNDADQPSIKVPAVAYVVEEANEP